MVKTATLPSHLAGKVVIAIILLMLALPGFSEEKFPVITVYKSATCGCCSAWIEHLQENGFEVTFENVTNLSVYKQKADLPYGLGSCHTGFVDGYAVEGHVPAEDIKRLLTEKPDIRGIAVPGMPMGSPGMDFGSRRESYQTLSFTRDGNTEVFAEH